MLHFGIEFKPLTLTDLSKYGTLYYSLFIALFYLQITFSHGQKSLKYGCFLAMATLCSPLVKLELAKKLLKGENAMSTSKVIDKQTLDFGGRCLQNLPVIDGDTMQDWSDCPLALQEFLAGLSVSPIVVRVDRSIKPQYPDFVKEVLHPELECEGPVEFHLRTGLTQWLHDKQKGGGYTTGNVIYEHLKENGLLPSCLNLQDGLAIQAKGIAVFRKLFQGKVLPLWKSIVRYGGGGLRVPCLCGGGSRVVVDWRWLDSRFIGGDPALRFVSN